MGRLIELITAVRNIRAMWAIAPQAEIRVLINIHDKASSGLISDNADHIKRLARISDLETGKLSRPKNSVTCVVKGLEVYVLLEGVIDIEKERARLQKEEGNISAEINSLAKRLADKEFLKKAPEEVVARQSERKRELETQLERIRDASR